jgi:hypothetical protein
VRVAAYLLPLWMTASLLLARQWRGGVRLSRIVLFATVSVGFLGVWHARNYLVAGYAGFSVHLDRAIYLRPGTAATAGGPELAYADARRLLLERVGQQDDADWTGDATLARRMRTAGLETLREHPLSTVLVHLRGAAVTLLAPGATETLALYRLERPVGFSVVLASGSPRLIAARMRDMPLRTLAVSILLGLPLYILVAAALMGVREALASVAGIVVVSAALYFIVIGGGPHAGSRFRVPATPCLAVLASAPLVRLLARRQPAHHDDPRRGR